MSRSLHALSATTADHVLPDVSDAWEQIRIPVLLCTVVVLVLIRVYLHYTGDAPELHAFPKRFADEQFSDEEPNSKPRETPIPDAEPTEKELSLRAAKGGVVKRHTSRSKKAT